MKNFLAISTFIGLSQLAFAGPSNPFLHSTMEAISKDVKIVAIPATAANPSQVKDDAIVTSIVRTRTAASQLLLVSERAEGEMFPPLLAGLPAEELKQKLVVYRQLLAQAKSDLEAMEPILKAELAKSASSRNFQALANALNGLQSTMKKAHDLFKPQNP